LITELELPARSRSNSDAGESRVDGRVLRGQRIRGALLRAMFDLMKEGNLRPNPQEIARRAGTSERVVYSHFRDVEGVRAAAVALQAQEEARLPLRPISPALPLEDRIRAYTLQQTRVFEVIAPFRRAANVFEPFSPKIAEGIRRARERTHARIEEVFQQELAGLEPTPRRRLRAKLIVVCTWPSWETLRTVLGLSTNQAREVMADLLRDILRD